MLAIDDKYFVITIYRFIDTMRPACRRRAIYERAGVADDDIITTITARFGPLRRHSRVAIERLAMIGAEPE